LVNPDHICDWGGGGSVGQKPPIELAYFLETLKNCIFTSYVY
jgi:hypothetical protein